MLGRMGKLRAAIIASALVVTNHASAAPARRTGYPCEGCLFDPPPEGATKAPLLVVLHGDAPGGKTPFVARDATPFARAAADRGISLFAPKCPTAKGCRKGSFWQWSEGDPPRWIEEQIDVIEHDYPIDPERVWIAGWSGGASFLGVHYARLGARYAAVVFVGGGIPPAAPGCAHASPPAYFLVGDRNPLHHLARELHARVAECSSDVTWDLLRGRNHAGEWRALGEKGKAESLLDWLAARPRAPAPEAPAAPPTVEAPAPTVEAPDPTRHAEAPPPPAPTAMPPRAPRCDCAMTIPATNEGFALGLSLVALLRARRAKRRSIRANA